LSKGDQKNLIDPTIAGGSLRQLRTAYQLDFASAVDAVHSVVAVRRGIAVLNAGVSPNVRIELRIGIRSLRLLAEAPGYIVAAVQLAGHCSPKRINYMKTLAVFALLTAFLSTSALAQGLRPFVDNELTTVWDTTEPLPPAQQDFVAVSLVNRGTAMLGHKGDRPGVPGERTIVIEIKDHGPATIPNNSSYPNRLSSPERREAP
jgi:hypothetical protein